jgi:hypothetical protein
MTLVISLVLITSVLAGLAFTYSNETTTTTQKTGAYVSTTIINEGTNGTLTIVVTSPESTTVGGLSCIITTGTGTGALHYGDGQVPIPNSTYIYVKPYLGCTTTDVLTGTSYVFSWNNSTSGNWTVHVFPTETYTVTEYAENYSTTVTLK